MLSDSRIEFHLTRDAPFASWHRPAYLSGCAMHASAIEIRLPLAAELGEIAAFIAEANAAPSGRCLHCPAASALGIRAALRDPAQFPGGWESHFVVARGADRRIVGVFGCQVLAENEPGYLWGPWLAEAPNLWTQAAPALLMALLRRLPHPLPRIDAFLDAENRAGQRFLTEHGFASGPLTHVYVVSRARWLAAAKWDLAPCDPLDRAHEVAFAKLHADTFPARGSTPAQALLTGRDELHAIFVVTEGLRLLGSVCVSVNQAPREGFVDYLAVRAAARGRGIGSRLLNTALRWVFETRNLPQAALTVSEWREGARRLYEQAGFALHASGIAMRRALR